ncbi:MAG: DNA-binding domain-containing protein [Pseudomonadota bacterium]
MVHPKRSGPDRFGATPDTAMDQPDPTDAQDLDLEPGSQPKHHHDDFAAAVLDPTKPVPAGVKRANGGDPQEAFNVYRNNVVASLAEALKAAFPITSQLLGEELRKALMVDYVRQYPPKNAVLATYGEDFPHVLAQHPATKARPFLADVAFLERRKLNAYHAADAPLLASDALAAVDPAELTAGYLVLHPAVQLLTSKFPFFTIYKLEKASQEGTLPEGGRKGVNMATSERVIVTRPHYDVIMHALGVGDFEFLSATARRIPFGAAAASGFEADPTFDLQACLGLCFEAGAFCGFAPATPMEKVHDLS